MGVDANELCNELKALRKGRGLSVPPPPAALGPAVRVVCGISPDDAPASTHRKVVARMRELAATLPGDLRVAVLAAFGLHEDATAKFLKERVLSAAQMLERDERTARRRIDEAIERLAELAATSTDLASPAASPGHRWHTEELRVALLVDGPMVDAFVFRRIVAGENGIEELDLALTLSAAARQGEPVRESEFEIDAFYGGALTGRTMESKERIRLALRLPAPLRRDQRHDFLLRTRAKLSAPYYVSVPRQPCELFDLHVRFAGEPPAKTGRLAEIFQQDASDNLVEGTPLELDASGALHTEFRTLQRGFAYGVRWQP